MASVTEYLAWRGDITFDEVKLTLVDALLLSLVSYVDLTGIIGEGAERTECTLAEAAEGFWCRHTLKEVDKSVSTAVRDAGKRLKEMAETKRFRDLLLRNYVNIIDDSKQEQFAAVEIVLGKKRSYISFAGTDDTLIGWKEDFNMCFLSPVPAQTDAKKYLERVVTDSGNKYYVGGHSKGGNLAVYSLIKSRKSCAKQIIRVYNFDGPGFDKEFIESAEYQERREKIEAWVPEASIVGLLLEHENAYRVVKSSYSGFLQHDANSWEVMGSEFVRGEKVKASNMRISERLKEWMGSLDREELENFGNAMYSVMTATNARTLVDLTQDMRKSIPAILRSLNTLDKQSKQRLLDMLKMLISANADTRQRAAKKKEAFIKEGEN